MRSVFIFVGVCVAVCGLSIAGFFGYFVSQEMNKPQWVRDLNDIKRLQETDAEKAIEKYKKLCADYEKQNIQETDAWTNYANFLWRARDYAGAMAVYKLGAAYAHKINKPDHEAWFLERQASCQHQMFLNGDIDKPDIALIQQAIKILPPSSGNIEWYQAQNQETLGQLYLDLDDFKNADICLDKAIAQFGPAKDPGMVIDALGWKMASLLEQKRGKEANDLFVKTARDNSENTDIVMNFRQKAVNHDLRAAGLYPNVRKLLKARDFAGLDKLADQLRDSKKQLSNGRWLLDAFYNEVNYVERDQFDRVWLEHIALLKDWVKSRPDSINAKLSLVHVLRSYAWKARGSGWSNTVTQDGWKRMAERMEESASYLEQVKNKVPDWYSSAQLVALGQSWSEKKYDNLTAESRLKYPDYDTVIFSKAYWLQPRWHGEEGEAEKYVEAEAAKRSTEDGDILYGRSSWWLECMLGDVFEETKMKWPRTKKGLLALRKKFPDSQTLRAELSILALSGDDLATARTAFDE
jgi:tetratricopeptide (TPR) repeat protein